MLFSTLALFFTAFKSEIMLLMQLMFLYSFSCTYMSQWRCKLFLSLSLSVCLCLCLFFLPSLLDSYRLCHLSDIKPCTSSSTFLPFDAFFLNSSPLHFKNGPIFSYKVNVPLMRFLRLNLFSRSILVCLRYSFLICPRISALFTVSDSNIHLHFYLSFF